MIDPVDPNEPLANESPPYEYSWDFAWGLGPWTTWLAPSVVNEAGGQYENFTRLNAPGLLDPNHLDGVGALRLVAHLPVPVPGSPGALNLVDAEFEITIRGTDFQANGAKLVVWIVKYIPEEGVFKNYYVGLTATNWANTGNDLAPLLTDEWQTLTVQLSDDPADWTYAGANNTQQGDWGDRYQEYDLGESLANVDTTLHLVLLSDEPDNAPTGFLDLANITVRTQTPATPSGAEQPELFYGLEDQVTNGSLAGDPSIGPEDAVFAVVAGSVRNGLVDLDPDTGAFTFTPDADFFGPTDFVGAATFRYTVSDGVTTLEKTAYLFIGGINDAPLATVQDETVDIAANEAFSYSLFKGTDVDTDERLTFRLVDGSATNGAVTLDTASGRYVFTPTAGFSGQATFSYVVSDGQLDSAPETVTLNVLPAGQEPDRLTFQEATDLLIAGDYQAFVYHTILLADAGDRNAAYHYGTWLGNGQNVARNTTLAAQYLGLATGLLADANLQLASLYVSGDGVDKDYAMARALLEAIPTNATAIYRLATLDDLGFGGPVNDAAAVAGYIKAAEMGNADAMYTLGRRYLSGEGVAQSAADAYFWLGVGLKLGGGPNIAQFDALLAFNMQQAADLGLSPSERADLDAAIAAWTAGQAVVVNDAPTAGEETGDNLGQTNAPFSGQLAPAADADGETALYMLVPDSAVNGTVTLDAVTGAYVFTPTADYFGPASFRYYVTDGQSNSAEVEVGLTVELVTAAAPDITSVNEAGELSVGVGAGLLANDSVSDDGVSLVISAVNGSAANVGQPVAGTYGDITIQADGSYVYQAYGSTAALIQGQMAVESITYVIQDQLGVTSTSTLTITVNGVGGTVLNGSGVLIGTQFGDVISGGTGSDTIVGQGGDDIIAGGADVANEVYGGVGNDTFVVTAAGDTIVEFENEGTDTVQTALGAYTLRQHVENLTFTGVGAFVGTGTDQNNLIVGGASNDTLSGQGGADILIGGAGADVLDGGAGADSVDYSASSAGVTINLLAGVGDGGDAAGDSLAGIEAVTGSGFADVLFGDAAANTLTGASGDDILRGGAGVDILAGGLGIDTVDYSAAAAGVRAQLNTNASTNDGDGGTDSFSGIENLTGSAFNDILIGDGAANVLRGGAGGDVLLGLGGDDVLWGGTGPGNQLYGGLGNDLYVLEANDTIVENVGEGTDTVDARINTYVLAGNVENLLFGGTGNFAGTGNALANVITGGTGNDVFRGRGGVDVLNGGAGIDTADYTLAAAGVVARIDQQRATNDGDGATDAYTGIENLIGSNFNDTLIGDANANVLMGGVGQDTLLGFGGNDILMGGSGGGNNQMQGGTGDDYYILDAFDTCVEFAGEGIDTVEARVGSYTLGNNVENLLYTGPGKFVGNGNALNNILTGGNQDDILRGKGGDDIIRGGLGKDEVQLRGLAAEYAVTAEGAGWRIIDNVAGRDGSTYVESIERLRFVNNATMTLSYPPPAPGALEPTDKGVGDGGGGPEVLPGAGDDFLLSKDAEAPQVLPGIFDDGGLILEPFTLAEWRMQMYGQAWLSGDAHQMIVQGRDGLFIRHDPVSDIDAFPGFDPWS